MFGKSAPLRDQVSGCKILHKILRQSDPAAKYGNLDSKRHITVPRAKLFRNFEELFFSDMESFNQRSEVYFSVKLSSQD